MFLPTIVSALVLSAAPATDAKSELDKLRGDWVMVSGHVDGKPVPEEHVKKNRITWDGEKCTLSSPHQSPEPIQATVTKLTPKGKGGEIEWKRDKGPHSDVTMLAVYEWTAPDSYTIAFDPKGKARPADVMPKDGVIVHVWKKAK
jgi:uncharacterized protein (TIGR03067 family)